MFKAMRNLPRSLFVLAALTLALTAAFACGGGGGSKSTSPAVTIPTKVSTTPTDGATGVSAATNVVVEFSESMDQASVLAATSVVAGGSSAVTITSIVWPTATQAQINFTKGDNTVYTVTIGIGAQDSQGTAVASAITFTFTTGSVPTVVSFSPLDGALNVPIAATVSVDFSETMDTIDTDEHVLIGGYAGTVSYAWSVGDTHLMVSFATSLDPNTTYSVSVLGNLADADGTLLGTTTTFSFSTGSTLASGSISGTISDDPDSPYDDALENTTVVAWDTYPWSDTDDPSPVLAVTCDASGAYSMNNLPDGNYWLFAINDSNGEPGITEIENGDALGMYQMPGMETSVPVSGSSVSGIDFSLYDPESITGDVAYAGASTVSLSSIADSLVFYAYQGDYAVGGTMYLTNDPDIIGTGEPDVSNYESGVSWTYWMTPLFEEGISVLGVATSSSWIGTVTNLDYIPTGSYNVLLRLPLPGDTEALGFAEQTASISGTGDDAVGIDVVLYDTIELAGYAFTNNSVSSDGTLYGSGTASLLNWPLLEAPTSEAINSTYTTGGFGFFGVPVGTPIALHGEPSSGDSSTYLSYNSHYAIVDSSWDLDDYLEIRLISWSLVNNLRSVCGYSPAIDQSKAFIAADVVDSLGDYLGGYEVIMSGNTVYYFNSVGACSDTGTTDANPAGPQVVVFNVDIPVDNMGSIAASVSGGIVSSVDIPVRSGELTIAEIEAP